MIKAVPPILSPRPQTKNHRRLPLLLVVGAALVLVAWDLPDPSAGAAKSVTEMQAALDLRPTVHHSLGVRSAQAVGDRAVRLEIGLSVTDAAGVPDSYRIISFDDPAYAYKKFVRPVSAKASKEVEAKGVDGSMQPEFSRTIVDLGLPEPMKPGAKYYVVAQGTAGKIVTGSMVTGAHTAAAVEPAGGPPRDPAIDQAVLGLRRIEPVGNGILLAEFGPGFSPKAGAGAESYKVKVNGEPRGVTAMGRITRVDVYLPTAWPLKAIPMHEIFLQLATPFQDGDKIRLEVADAVTGGNRVAALDFRDAASFSPSIKVNQVGYLTDSPVKIAYLGRWLGDFPAQEGGAALYFSDPPKFEVRSAEDGKVAFEGKSRLIHRSGEKSEGAYKVDYSGENVYELDFTGFKKPGRYFVSVPGVGRSPEFSIGDNVYEQAFQVQSYGVFAQRSGQELDAPFSPWRRVASLTKGVVPTTLSRYVGEGNAFQQLPKSIEGDGKPIATTGGHHDAGDYNPRSHIEVAQILMNAYEMDPQKFRDGDLNLPESGNGIPDILDEAAWAMRLWPPLQRADGAVRAGTESNGDPNFIQTVELYPLGDFAFAPDAEASFQFAATFAQASRIWRGLGKKAQADQWLAMAEKAYKWADANPPAKTDGPGQLSSRFLSPKAYAAAELLHTTGKPGYNADFLKAAVWKDKPDAEVEEYNKYNQENAAWAYLKCPPQSCDAAVRESIRRAILKRADDYIRFCSKLAYKSYRHPYSPINWGTAAYPNSLEPVLWAWKLTKEPKYLEWIIRTVDNTLGTNPLGRSYIVGLGGRTVRAPLHNSRYSHFGEVVPGMHVQGPNQKGDGYNVKETAYPPLRADVAPLYTYVDAHFAIAMDEGMIPSMTRCMAVFGLLRPDAKPSATPAATKK